ncbi:cytochrome c oxidase subunit 8A, mitochondrial [Trichechus inunguis]
MSALKPLLLRGLTAPARRVLVPRAQINSKPPREQLGTMCSNEGSNAGLGVFGGRERGHGARGTDYVIGLTSCFVCFLGPAGWVMAHMENYKKRE